MYAGQAPSHSRSHSRSPSGYSASNGFTPSPLPPAQGGAYLRTPEPYDQNRGLGLDVNYGPGSGSSYAPSAGPRSPVPSSAASPKSSSDPFMPGAYGLPGGPEAWGFPGAAPGPSRRGSPAPSLQPQPHAPPPAAPSIIPDWQTYQPSSPTAFPLAQGGSYSSAAQQHLQAPQPQITQSQSRPQSPNPNPSGTTFHSLGHPSPAAMFPSSFPPPPQPGAYPQPNGVQVQPSSHPYLGSPLSLPPRPQEYQQVERPQSPVPPPPGASYAARQAFTKPPSPRRQPAAYAQLPVTPPYYTPPAPSVPAFPTPPQVSVPTFGAIPYANSAASFQSQSQPYQTPQQFQEGFQHYHHSVPPFPTPPTQSQPQFANGYFDPRAPPPNANPAPQPPRLPTSSFDRTYAHRPGQPMMPTASNMSYSPQPPLQPQQQPQVGFAQPAAPMSCTPAPPPAVHTLYMALRPTVCCHSAQLVVPVLEGPLLRAVESKINDFLVRQGFFGMRTMVSYTATPAASGEMGILTIHALPSWKPELNPAVLDIVRSVVG